jgi:hypothetical protein
VQDWEKLTSSDLSDVKHWWAEAPFSILLLTGHTIDVIDIPAWLGNSAIRHLNHSIPSVRTNAHTGRERTRHRATRTALPPWPVAATPAGRWQIVVTPGLPLLSELTGRVDVSLHTLGSWIIAPPSRTPDGPVRWLVPPATTRWDVPDAGAVQEALVSALVRPGPTFDTPRLAA